MVYWVGFSKWKMPITAHRNNQRSVPRAFILDINTRVDRLGLSLCQDSLQVAFLLSVGVFKQKTFKAEELVPNSKLHYPSRKYALKMTASPDFLHGRSYILL